MYADSHPTAVTKAVKEELPCFRFVSKEPRARLHEIIAGTDEPPNDV